MSNELREEHARRLLSDKLFNEAFETLEKNLLNSWTSNLHCGNRRYGEETQGIPHIGDYYGGYANSPTTHRWITQSTG
jgi:hypothetical protein